MSRQLPGLDWSNVPTRMNTRQAAEYIGCFAPGTLTQDAHDNRRNIPFIKLCGRRLYLRSQLDNWMQDNGVPSSVEASI